MFISVSALSDENILNGFLLMIKTFVIQRFLEADARLMKRITAQDGFLPAFSHGDQNHLRLG